MDFDLTEEQKMRYFRDARVTEIYEGTSEIMRMTIARSIIREGQS